MKEKHAEKLQKYQKLDFEIRVRRPGYEVTVVPIVIGCLGGWMERAKRQIELILTDKKRANWTSQQVVKSVLLESETIIMKITSGLIKIEWTVVFFLLS